MRIRNTYIAASVLAALTLTGCASPAAPSAPSSTPTESTADAEATFLAGFKLVQPTATGTDEEIIAFGNAVCAKLADPSNAAIELDLEDPDLQPVIELAESTICP